MSKKSAGNSKRWIWVLALTGTAVVLVAIFMNLRTEERVASASLSNAATPELESPRAGIEDTARSDSSARQKLAAGASERGTDGASDFPFIDRDMNIAIRWARVDLDDVRKAMPDNLFWKLGTPTSDESVKRERAEERERWNVEFGKVLSGTATEAEIDDYYAQRYRLSADYIEFASHMLDQYGDVLPERDVGLLELSVKMHHSRLQEMPRRLAEAKDRKALQDRLREAWLADEAAFEQAQSDEVERAQQ